MTRPQNLRVLLTDGMTIEQAQQRVAAQGLVVHSHKCLVTTPWWVISVQCTLLCVLSFGEGETYNEALSHACNAALRRREEALRKRA